MIRLDVLVCGFKPSADLLVTVQPRTAGGLQLNLGIVQREKLVNLGPLVE